MTIIPVDLGWLILAGFILITAMVYGASFEANRHATRHQRKWMKEREKAAAEETAKAQQFYEEAVQKEVALLKDKRSLHEREAELGRKAHDLAAQTQMVLRQANSRDPVPTMQEL